MGDGNKFRFLGNQCSRIFLQLLVESGSCPDFGILGRLRAILNCQIYSHSVSLERILIQLRKS